MGIISSFYRKNFVCRYDKEAGIPYHSHLDFPGLKQEAFVFTNSLGIEIHCFYYQYETVTKEELILFLHGIGPGHTAYLAEIEALCKKGYRVLTLDYEGCGESGGKLLRSLNAPTKDASELLDHLSLDKPVVLVGHSLGGFTSLNLIHLRKEIKKAVILSGFLSIPSLVESKVKPSFLAKRVLAYEKKQEPESFALDNLEYLKTTEDDLFFIQSEDDGMVPYGISLQVVEGIKNPHIKTLRVSGKKHNPNYSLAAVSYMNEVFGNYYSLIKQKKIKTDEDKIAYFKDVSLDRLVEQDPEIIDAICRFLS